MVAPSTYGATGYGTSPYGAGDPQLVVAYAISTREIYLLFSAALQSRSIVLPGDALNPSTWAVVRLDTNENVPIVGVTLRSPTEVVIACLDPLPPFTAQAGVLFPNLLGANRALVSLPRDVVVAGITEQAMSTPALVVQNATITQRDLLNSPARALAGEGGGTLVIAGGDYVNQSGDSLLKKLILRRLITTPGDFFFLPNYGVGLKVKQPIPGGDVVKLKAAIEKQVALEPEVSSVKATVVQSQNMLTVTVACLVKATGATLTVGFSTKFQGG